ncbi:general secretion pathway protein GspK [Rhodoblastus acidophilus]|uniref:General secretion pathway protein GspK n=1 Tax=Candidatus Rhodoblastus alkanivorans TaxID=2954117 RepID=A0ABS9ZA94_9HYPH|nr:type II secretion system protein GspK [Candidatus Rhodoblastus alkanivorans]MCI4677154.1 general secretion pathway protein GspK [Candidatus Rhodoblastus alkanivorans]MCI4684507.1 general secretion pathway protein GspK [Candidatus Rhodoblastus alkanivorans]MDI4641828.1 general secretion pathway protein GspK [Rhodoblastus acidophilus]
MAKPGGSKSLSRKGFALLIVIWGLGAIALLVLSFLTTGRLRLQTAFNLAGAAQAQSIAEAAANLAILSLVAEKDARSGPQAPAPHDGAPRFCALGDAAVALAIEDESGKIDLNAASEGFLRQALAGLLGLGPARADAIAGAIAEFRTPPPDEAPPASNSSDKPFAPKRAAFQTVMEFDQVAPIDQATFRALKPFVTVHSRADGIDPKVAPPALLAALLGMAPDRVAELAAAPYPNNLNRDDPRFPVQFRQTGGNNAFLIHAEAVLANGPAAVWEALVETDPSDGGPYAIREIRHGPPRFLDALRAMRGARETLGPC